MKKGRVASRVRIQFVALLMLLGLGALGLRLWWIQVAHGAEWTSQLRGSSQATVRIPSVRGEIKDRNGVTLVQNRASYEVDFYLPEMVKGYRERVGRPPETEYRATINGMPKDLKEADIVKIVNDGVVPRLDELDLARDRNAKGVIDGVVREEPPQAGANVVLTLDAKIQAITEEALRAVPRGAAVVMNPNNGDILAMASVPSFDPNTFIPSIKAKDWEVLRENPAHPLIDRAISAFPPGSTCKLVTALAGLRKGLANNRFDCGGGVSYGDHFFHCWISEKGGSHGVIGLADAIKVSCNSFFYQFGNAAGINAIDETGETLGLGKGSGIEVSGEQPGVLPGPDWMRINYPREKWTSAHTDNVSIGQGFDLVSPLQEAVVYSTVANGGVSYYPRLVKDLVNADGKSLLNDKGQPVISRTPKVHGDLRNDFTPQQIELARRGL